MEIISKNITENKILTISDGKKNGKGGNHYLVFDTHFFIYNVYIKNKKYIIILN